jgi:hypothetical protein
MKPLFKAVTFVCVVCLFGCATIDPRKETAIKAIQAADFVVISDLDTSYAVYNLPESSSGSYKSINVNVNNYINSPTELKKGKETDKFGKNIQMEAISNLSQTGLFKTVAPSRSKLVEHFIDVQCALASFEMKQETSLFRRPSPEYKATVKCNILDERNNLLTSFNIDEDKHSLSEILSEVGQEISNQIKDFKTWKFKQSP